MPLTTRLFGDVELNGVRLTASAGTPNLFTVDAALNTFHDFMFIEPAFMVTDGTAPTQNLANEGTPRILLARGQSVQWARIVPPGWNQVSANLLFTKEAAGAGNIHWQVEHQLIDFLTGESLNGAVTTTDLGGVSVPTTAVDSKYYIIPTLQAIATPPQPFGIPPLLRLTLTRLNDATDTYVGNVGLAGMTMSRTST